MNGLSAEDTASLIEPRRVTGVALILVCLLVVAGLAVQFAKFALDSPTMMGFGPLLDPGREQNVPMDGSQPVAGPHAAHR